MFTNSFEGPVLDYRYYGGGCSPHYILNTRFRKPFNVESYTPQVSADEKPLKGSGKAGKSPPAGVAARPAAWASLAESLYL